jgi:hypothetical protein
VNIDVLLDTQFREVSPYPLDQTSEEARKQQFCESPTGKRSI